MAWYDKSMVDRGERGDADRKTGSRYDEVRQAETGKRTDRQVGMSRCAPRWSDVKHHSTVSFTSCQCCQRAERRSGWRAGVASRCVGSGEMGSKSSGNTP